MHGSWMVVYPLGLIKWPSRQALLRTLQRRAHSRASPPVCMSTQASPHGCRWPRCWPSAEVHAGTALRTAVMPCCVQKVCLSLSLRDRLPTNQPQDSPSAISAARSASLKKYSLKNWLSCVCACGVANVSGHEVQA